ncbi:MAG: uroporphyrinogen-III synthase [Rhodobacteraceae bacterium]|nr:uroporphyrinogen-III synthase [Paracoccaceae bacterium]
MLTLLMTRPLESAKQFVAQLPAETRGLVTPIYSPLIDIVPSVTALDFGNARGLVFTSANGVRIAAGLNDQRHIPCYCVGKATTQTARQAGWQAEYMGENSDALIRTLHQNRPSAPLLHIRGAHARGAVAARLTALGCATVDQVIYDQPLLAFNNKARQALAGAAPILAPLFSPRTARHFADIVSSKAPLLLVGLSKAVTDPVKALKYNKLCVAEQPNTKAMIRCIVALINDAKRVEGAGPAQ